jgi:hypothetical protein
MRHTGMVHINHAPVTAVLFSAVCWLGLYGVFANFAQRGFELLQRPGIPSAVEGSALVGLHAVGLLLILGCGLCTIAVLIKSAINAAGPNHRLEG